MQACPFARKRVFRLVTCNSAGWKDEEQFCKDNLPCNDPVQATKSKTLRYRRFLSKSDTFKLEIWKGFYSPFGCARLLFLDAHFKTIQNTQWPMHWKFIPICIRKEGRSNFPISILNKERESMLVSLSMVFYLSYQCLLPFPPKDAFSYKKLTSLWRCLAADIFSKPMLCICHSSTHLQLRSSTHLNIW
jgi:hypothetical protein